MILDKLFRFVQDDPTAFGDVDMNDDLLLDVQTVTDMIDGQMFGLFPQK